MRLIRWLLWFNKMPAAMTIPRRDDVLDRDPREAVSKILYKVGALLFNSIQMLDQLKLRSLFVVVMWNEEGDRFFLHSDIHSALTTCRVIKIKINAANGYSTLGM